MSVTSPSLALRALFARTASRLAFDRPAGTIAGVSPAVKALAAVAAARARPGLTLLVVPTDRDVEQMCSDARYFYAALEGAAASAAEVAVVPCPSLQVDPYRGMAPHFKVAAARARALYLAATGQARLIVASAAALLPRVGLPERLLRAAKEIRSGTEIAPHDLADLLADAGFAREDPVDEHGSFAVRGGIVDIFPANDEEPVRLEFVGDMVETLRRFDPATQRSTSAVDHVVVVPVRETFGAADGDDGPADPVVPLLDFLSTRGVRVLVSEFEHVSDQAIRVREQLQASFGDARGRAHLAPPAEAFVSWDDLAERLGAAPKLEELAVGESGPGLREVRCQPAMEFHGRVGDWVADLRQARERGDTVLFIADSAGRAERAVEILRDYDIVAVPVERAEDAHAAAVLVAVGALSRGFRLTDAALQVYVERDVFDEERRGGDKRPGVAKAFLSDLRDLKVGDLVVHVDHGIGEFVGLKQLGVSGSDRPQEFLELRYHDDAKLFVPVERLDLSQKYTGGSRPALDRLGGTTWEKAKSRVKKAMRDMAEELLRLYAQRKAVTGFAFSPDTHWQEEFEGAFPYELTTDQTTAIADIKRDMEVPTPMDRLLCGDVGYGKTEV
ncbi:MAG TPA: CarD family transcriptional regulator, partial [Gemmatimonadaceae bacterium]|nr:CarD family transcriptional regulator [Gemmatimonadaceae bacterium]